MRNAKAFEELCKQFGPKLERFCVRMLHDGALAEDIAQETLLRLWQHADSFDEDRDPSSWLYTVARNLCIESLRARARTVAMATLPERASDDDPGERIANDDERSMVRKVLAEMPARQREMLLLKDVERVGYPVLARHLGVTEPSARVLLFRARRHLRDSIAAATGAIVVWWGAMKYALLQRARKANVWVQTASTANALIVNAAIGLAMASALSAPGAASAASAASAPESVAVAVAVPSNAFSGAHRAPRVHVQTIVRSAATAPAIHVDASKGANVDARVPSDDADGHAWAHTWRDRNSGRSAILSALDLACVRTCPTYDNGGQK